MTLLAAIETATADYVKKELVPEWVSLTEKLDTIRVEEMKLRIKIYSTLFPSPEIGTNNLEIGNGCTLKAVRRLNYNITNEDLLIEALEKIRETYSEPLVRWKPSLNLAAYKNLSDADRELVNKALTITEATPSLDIHADK